MTPEQAKLQRMLDRLARDTVRLHDAAVEVYGEQAHIFAESDGGLSIMVGDDTDASRVTSTKRQEHIKMTANWRHRLGVGAW